MKIKENRKITTNALYRKCNEQAWYTRGTNEEYEEMFAKAKENLTTEALYELAKDIVEHTAPNCFAYIDGDPICHVMFELAEIAVSTFEMGE